MQNRSNIIKHSIPTLAPPSFMATLSSTASQPSLHQVSWQPNTHPIWVAESLHLCTTDAHNDLTASDWVACVVAAGDAPHETATQVVGGLIMDTPLQELYKTGRLQVSLGHCFLLKIICAANIFEDAASMN